MKQLISFRIFSVLCVLVMLFFFKAPSIGLAEGTTCSPVDVIFLVDQTSSELPANFHQAILQMVVHLLNNDRLYHCSQVVHRVAVASWNGHIMLDLTPLNFDVMSGPSAIDEFEKGLWGKYSLQSDSTRDISSGLQSVKDILKRSGNTPERKQLVLILGGNGGIPCNDWERCAHYAIQDYFNRLLPDSILSNLPAKVKIAAITLPVVQPDYIQYGNEFNQAITNVSGKAITVEQPMDMVIETLGIIQEFYPAIAVKTATTGSISVDPFQQQLNFMVFRLDESQQIHFVEPGGQSIPAVPDEKHALFLNTVLHHPKPGQWNIMAGDQTLVYYESVRSFEIVPQILDETDTSLAEPVLPQYNEPGEKFNSDDQFNLSFQLRDQFGTPYDDYEEFPAKAILKLIEPNGEKVQVECTYEHTRYVCQEPLHVSLVGNYQWVIEVQSPSADPKNNGAYSPLTQSQGQYSVMAVQPVKMLIEQPENKRLNLHSVGVPFTESYMNIVPVSIKARLISSEGEALGVHKVLSGNPDQSVQAVLTNIKTGDQESIYLRQDPSEPGAFEGKIGLDLVASGEYRLEVSIIGGLTPVYRMARDTAVVQFTRADRLLTSPGFYMLVFTFVALVIAASIGWLIYSHTNTMRGALEFLRPGGDRYFERISLEKGARKVKLQIHGNPNVSPILWHIKKIGGSLDKEQAVSRIWFEYENGQRKEMEFSLNSAEKGEPHSENDQLKSDHELSGCIMVRYLPNDGGDV